MTFTHASRAALFNTNAAREVARGWVAKNTQPQAPDLSQIGGLVVSVYQCDIHGARIRGALEGLRVSLLLKSASFTRKLRVCPTDLDELLKTHAQEWVELDDSGLEAPSTVCSACEETLGVFPERGDAFIYVWRRSSPQREFYAVYCLGCSDRLIRDFQLKEQERYRAPA